MDVTLSKVNNNLNLTEDPVEHTVIYTKGGSYIYATLC